MRLLVDECVDWRMLRDLSEYNAKTVKQVGWGKLDDGSLLKLAATEFDVFLTVDKDLPFQQNIRDLKITVIILRARTTRLADLREMLEPLHKTIKTAKSGEMKVLDWRDLG
jgi:predicted nuclease of predicted toxin-antitoxin system